MGFFSSIGDFFTDAWHGVKDFVGGVADTVGDVVDTVSPVLGPAGDVVGGLLGSDSQKSINSQNSAFAREQLQFQKDYIQNRLQWQVEDAKKAGLHPMVGAGISPTSFSSVSLNNSPISSDWIADAGQNISYAAAKAKDRRQQQEAWNFTKEMNEEQIEGVRLDNELKVMQIMSQLALLNQTGPSAPSLKPYSFLTPGQGDSPFIEKPIVRDGWLLDEKGRKISVIPSEAMKGRTEDVLGVEWFPFISSAYRDFKGRAIGHEINGHWWHGPDKGYLPYPPKMTKKGGSNVKVSDYYFQSHRY